MAPAHAVDLLKQGQGVSWSQLTRLCSPLDDAIVSSLAGKTLADEFTQLALLIRNALTSHGGGGAGQHERVCRLNLKLQSVVINIHNPPGLSHFLLPSLFPDLQHTASGGPVVENPGISYSDILILIPDSRMVYDLIFTLFILLTLSR